ncbi:MAG: 50S ribosome-binding GTPase [bacterium]|nr:50S ribosome-binding GTPase [bacterium]
MNKRCIGCGAVLQDTDKKALGYTPKLNNKYCMRCFRLTNYNDLTVSDVAKDNNKIIDIVNKSGIYSFFLIDSLTINKEIIDIYSKITTKKCILLTKVDLLPRNINLNNYVNNIKYVYKIKEEIYPLSVKSKLNINKIVRIMDEKNIKKAYVLGCTNAGKSTMINMLLNNNTITTSRMPNTTIDFININLEDKIITDTPGFMVEASPFITDNNYIKKNDYKESLKPLTYQTKDNTNLIIEERFVLGSFGFNSVTTYFNNNIVVKKSYKDITDYTSFNILDNTDIVIKNLGFINIKKNASIKVANELVPFIEFRPSLVGISYE